MAFGRGMMGGMGWVGYGLGLPEEQGRGSEENRREGCPVRPGAAQADRAYNKAINAAAYDDSDLIQGVETGRSNSTP